MNTTANLKIATITEADDVPPMPEGVEPVVKINGKEPAMFAVDRGEGLEPLMGVGDLESARKTVKKQVVSAKTSVVYIYQLVGAEAYQPTSLSLTAEEVMANLER